MDKLELVLGQAEGSPVGEVLESRELVHEDEILIHQVEIDTVQILS